MNLHLLIWKHLIAHMVRIDTEDEKFEGRQVWKPAWIRMERKILALQEKAQAKIRLYESRGNAPPSDIKSRSAPMHPIAALDSDTGIAAWTEDIKLIIDKLTTTK